MTKIVVVTGCSSGVGLETAIMLATNPEQCYKVYATMRNMTKRTLLENAAGTYLNKTLFIEELDISKEESIEKFGKSLLQREGRIDILVNNAATSLFGIFEDVSIELAQEVFQTNFFGTVRLIQEFIPQMKKQKNGIIAFVSSSGGILPIPFLEYYVASKHAVQGLLGSLAPQLRLFNVRVTTIHPGPIDTPLMQTALANSRRSFTDEKQSCADELTVKLRNDFLAILKSRKPSHVQSPKEVAEVVVKAISDSPPKCRYQTSKMVREKANSVFVDPDGDVAIDAAEKMLRDCLK